MLKAVPGKWMVNMALEQTVIYNIFFIILSLSCNLGFSCWLCNFPGTLQTLAESDLWDGVLFTSDLALVLSLFLFFFHFNKQKIHNLLSLI